LLETPRAAMVPGRRLSLFVFLYSVFFSGAAALVYESDLDAGLFDGLQLVPPHPVAAASPRCSPHSMGGATSPRARGSSGRVPAQPEHHPPGNTATWSWPADTAISSVKSNVVSSCAAWLLPEVLNAVVPALRLGRTPPMAAPPGRQSRGSVPPVAALQALALLSDPRLRHWVRTLPHRRKAWYHPPASTNTGVGLRRQQAYRQAPRSWLPIRAPASFSSSPRSASRATTWVGMKC